MVKAYIEKEDKHIDVPIKDSTTVSELLKELGLLSSTSIITRDDNILLDDDMLDDKDRIRILSVISGG